jgi:multidrug efflux system outer membrane protein
MSARPICFACLAAVALTGCASMAPRYTTPAPPVPERFPAAGEPAATTPAAMAWTAFYADPRLRQVQDLACANSRDLRVAALTVDKAMAAYRIQRAELLPHVNLSATGSKQRVPASLSSSGKEYIAGSYQVGLGITAWEVDLFGRLRSLKQAALDQYLGTEQARAATLIALRASVADAYLALAADRESLRLAQDTLETQAATLAMTERKFAVGAGSELDLRRSQVSVESARVDVASYTRLAALDRSTLDLLAGVPVPEALLPADLGGVAPLREDMAAGLPATVLANRPDVLQAEHQLRAANANIGAARAAFFPTVSLTTAFGTADAHASGLFTADSRAWSISPQAVLPIFDYGARKARLAVSKIDREIALAQYEKAIQAGYKEVGDALVQRDTLRQQRQAQEALAQATGASFRLATARFQAGLDSSLAVLDAQRADNAARQGLIALRRAELGNLVALYKALGGGAGPAGSGS